MSGYQTFNFQVTPQKACCLWPNSPGCKNLPNKKCYCCAKGTNGRPVSFSFTPDSERWKVCNRLRGCSGNPSASIYGPGAVNNGDGVF